MLASTFFISSAQAAINDFTISDFQADYYLVRDKDNRSHLKTVEKITAEFPAFDQNHGIERAIPRSYQDHPVNLSIQSVTDANGAALNYSTYESNDNEVLRIGDADTYVHGSRVYVVTYTQQDVTLDPDNASIDEFYWDTNGTEWGVPFGRLTARVHLPSDLTGKLNGNSACYIGGQGSSERCTITKATEGDQTVFTMQAGRTLAAGENVTFAIGFQPDTFAAYQPSLLDRLAAIWGVVTVVSGFVAFGAIFFLFFYVQRINGRDKELGTIVPEYLPPGDASVTVSSTVAKSASSTMTAQLLDLAVRHYIKLYEVKEKTIFSPAQYEMEIVKDISDLRPEEQEILKDMFDNNVTAGQRINLKTLQNNMGFYRRTLNNDTDLTKLMRSEYAHREKKPENVKRLRRIALVFLIGGVLLLSLWLLVAALFAFVFSFTVWSLTDKGLGLKRYLEGLKLYIKVAEQDRIKMLQSPEGAEKVASVASGTEPAQLIKLYERVLPYAVLFGQEKEWSKQLGAYYENIGTQPDWYNSHSGAFNAAVFVGAMSSFSTSTTTYTSSSSSSSSGSGGGGSSGGGGGGGGGGGW